MDWGGEGTSSGGRAGVVRAGSRGLGKPRTGCRVLLREQVEDGTEQGLRCVGTVPPRPSGEKGRVARVDNSRNFLEKERDRGQELERSEAKGCFLFEVGF